MIPAIVPVKNVTRLAEAGEALIHRNPGMPGMGLIHGHTGFGKTTAVTWYSQRCDAVSVRAKATWTPFVMMEDISRELDLAPRSRISHMVDAVVKEMTDRERPLFIDEFDYVVDSTKMCDTVRDLHDLSDQPVIAIGMQDIAKKLKRREQFTGRIAQDVAFQPLDIEDAQLLVRKQCEVRVSLDLLHHLLAATRGSIRLTLVGLAKIEAKAKTAGLPEIGLAQWGASTPMFTGSATAGGVR